MDDEKTKISKGENVKIPYGLFENVKQPKRNFENVLQNDYNNIYHLSVVYVSVINWVLRIMVVNYGYTRIYKRNS